MWKFLYNWAELYTQWILVVFCLERIIIIFFPFNGKRFLTLKREIIVILGTALLCFLWASPKLIYIYNSVIKFNEQNLKFISLFTVTLNKYAWSTIVLFLSTMVLFGKIILISKQRRKQFGHKQNQYAPHTSPHSKELQVVKIFFMMSVVQTSIYIYCGISWGGYYSNDVVQWLEPHVVSTFGTNGLYAEYLSLLVRIWNFFVYLARIQAFREVFVQNMTCGKVILSKSLSSYRGTTSTVK